jgi:hypothetical protein
VDLSQFDLDNADSFNDWLSYHQAEHAQIRQALGIT